VADNTFGDGRPGWLDHLGNVRNTVRQELISRQLDKHLPKPPARVLDVGAGQGTQSIRLARAGHQVLAVEPDPEMRAVFEAALSAERAEVQDRVIVRAGSVGDLAPVTSGQVYDAVLVLGVLMYLPASRPVIAELAAYVAPGGFLAAAVRTTTSALWRPAARQDWQAALAAFDEHDRALAEGRDMRYINEIGAPARADDLGALTTLAAAHGLQLENWYGVRIAVDPDELDPAPPSDPRQLAALLAVEERLGATDPYRQLGQLAHLILRKANAAPLGGCVCRVGRICMRLATPIAAGLVRLSDVHDLDRKVAGRAEHLVRHGGPVQQARPVRPAARPEHELAGAGFAGGLDQSGSGVVGPDFTQGPAQFAEQPAVLLEPLCGRLVEEVQRADVHGHQPGVGKPGEAGGVADEPLVGGRPLKPDHDDRGLNLFPDAVGGGVRRDGVGNGVIEPQLRQLPQCGQVREAEVVR
jgi:SAM-dependent methyltransferase